MKLISLLCYLFVVSFVDVFAQQADSVPLHQSFTIQSKYLNELRTINVWTPENNISNNTALPVLYMLDGGY